MNHKLNVEKEKMNTGSNIKRYEEWTKIFLNYIHNRTIEAHSQEDEGYKFQSVQHFLSNFNIEATDLTNNLDEAILSNNLVVGAMYFPKKMLLAYAELYTEETREVLANLFDESKEVTDRITAAKKAFDDLEARRSEDQKKPVANTYIGLRFLSLLLGYRYPDNYNPLKPTEWKVFCRFIDPSFSMPQLTPPGEQYNIYCKYIEPLREYIKTRPEMAEVKNKLVEGLEFRDDEFRWMVQDVIYITALQYAAEKSNENESKFVDDAAVEEEHIVDTSKPIDGDSELMPLEKYLEDYVVYNWRNVNFGETLNIYVDDEGSTGQQYTTDVGIIDILAVDENKDFVVIELKKDKTGYKVVGQILNYIGWVEEKLAQKGQKVRGIIIVGEADKTLLSAAKIVSDRVEIKEYKIKMSLEDVAT